MTNQNPPSDQSEKDTAPAPPPVPQDTKKSAQPLNPAPPPTRTPDSAPKPDSKPDPQTMERFQKLITPRAQSSEAPKPADKTAPAKPVPPAEPASGQPEKKDQPPAPSADAAGGKKPAWPKPATSLGGSSPLANPDAAPASSTAGTARLNRPPADPAAGTLPVEPSSDAGDRPPRTKAEVQASMRTTSATRNVPKGRVAQEVWKVILQAMTGSQVHELTVEVKGLSVVGRADPDGKSKADLDLTPLDAAKYGVSRQHLIIVPTDEGPCIIDMNSANGTWINGLYLEPGRRYRLRTNDRMELGSLKLLVRVMAPAEQKPPDAAKDN